MKTDNKFPISVAGEWTTIIRPKNGIFDIDIRSVVYQRLTEQYQLVIIAI
ncbi:MAG: hypothetical protein FD164_2286 [Nitrospirae bacterium]|nr:MAG: hypothetical protein FD164_2286 [Nitrospirota bacterium]